MTDCTASAVEFSKLSRRKLQVNFGGGAVSSDGGVLLLREVDRRLKLTERVAAVLHDPRDPDLITHPLVDLLRQRIYGIAQGYEDLNDHERLREDVLLQSVLEREQALGSAPTLCRMENRARRAEAWALHREMVETFIASFRQAPEELVLDFDATEIRCMANKRGGSSTATTITTVSCRYMYSAASNCWWPTCGPARLTKPSTLGRF